MAKVDVLPEADGIPYLISEPLIHKVGNGYEFSWCEGDEWVFKANMTHIKESSRGELSGELTIEHEFKGTLLDITHINLLSEISRTKIAKKLATRHNIINWDFLIEQVCTITVKRYREGEPAQEIWPSEEDTLTPEYLLEPILYLNHPAVLFGDYGSLKSLTALATAYIIQLPYPNNPLGLITAEEPNKCLYLDYEDDSSSFRKRWSALESGFGQGAMPVFYLRMTAPLADSTEQVRHEIDKKGIRFLIVDSLGPAARGNLNDAEPAIRYHAALRQLGITSLTLAHTSKDQLSSKKTIFGSVFFTNLSRSVWECKSLQETGEDEAIISLKNTKANLSRLHPPMGYKFNFTDNCITIARTDLRDTGLSSELPLSLRIKDLLRQGAMTVKDIAETLETNEPSARTVIYRMKQRGQLIKIGESWGLTLEP